jgi:LacI family gluconate utilization system Gnt-I transcriptional repressor
MKKPVTLSDVSRVAGVSLITVSRVLHRSAPVSEETRGRVLAAVDATGYVPNLTARSLVQARSNTVGVAIPVIRSSLFANFIEDLGALLQDNGMQLMVGMYGWQLERETEIVTGFLGRQADAIVLNGFTHADLLRTRLARFSGPIVETGNLGGEALDMAVGFSNFGAAYDMTRYLIERGYRQIAVVRGETAGNDQAKDRFAGFLAAMRDAGRSVPESHVILAPQPTTIEFGRRAMLQLLDQAPDVDAVFLQADGLAHGAAMACASRGLAIPTQMALAGFGDLSLSALLPVPLTTIRVRAEAMGTAAARLILQRLAGEVPETPTVDVGYELVPRASA